MHPATTLAESCPPLLRGPISESDAAELASVLRVLADPSRLRLLSLIDSQPDQEACVCHLTGPLALAQPTVSHHLKVLHAAGLVERQQRGNWVFYRVVPEALDAIRKILR